MEQTIIDRVLYLIGCYFILIYLIIKYKPTFLQEIWQFDWLQSVQFN